MKISSTERLSNHDYWRLLGGTRQSQGWQKNYQGILGVAPEEARARRSLIPLASQAASNITHHRHHESKGHRKWNNPGGDLRDLGGDDDPRGRHQRNPSIFIQPSATSAVRSFHPITRVASPHLRRHASRRALSS